MHGVYERCCGIDVHKKFVVVCLCILTVEASDPERDPDIHDYDPGSVTDAGVAQAGGL